MDIKRLLTKIALCGILIIGGIIVGNLNNALAFTLKFEGGYVNHPADPGGETNQGITQRTYDNYRKGKKLVPAPVKGITPGEVASIYREGYWNVVKGESLPSPLDVLVFDASVNIGPGRSLQLFKRTVEETTQGQSLDDWLCVKPELRKERLLQLVGIYNKKRMEYYRGLRADLQKHFLKGWGNRVKALSEYAATLI